MELRWHGETVIKEGPKKICKKKLENKKKEISHKECKKFNFKL